MPLNLLSIPSILSTFATVLLIGIVVFDGLYLAKAPGSIRDPMPTSLGPDMKGMNWLGGIGLVLAGFGGHAVIPSIAKDMRNHQSMERVFNIAFVGGVGTTLTAVCRRGRCLHRRRSRVSHVRRHGV